MANALMRTYREIQQRLGSPPVEFGRSCPGLPDTGAWSRAREMGGGNYGGPGLHNSVSLTLADGAVYLFYGSWIDLGLSGSSINRYFGIGDEVYSGVKSTAISNGYTGTIFGAFTGFDFGVSYGTSPTTLPQDGSTAGFSYPYLSAIFYSESVPEPGTLGLLAAGLALLVSRRKRSA